MTLASMREPLDVWVLEELGKLLEDLGGELDLEEAVDALGVQDHGERRPHQLLLGQAAPFAQERLQVGKVVLDLFHVHALVLGRAVHAPLDGIVVEPLGIRVEVGLGPGNELGEERGPKLAVCLEHLGVPRVGDDLLDQLLARLHRRLVEVASALSSRVISSAIWVATVSQLAAPGSAPARTAAAGLPACFFVFDALSDVTSSAARHPIAECQDRSTRQFATAATLLDLDQEGLPIHPTNPISTARGPRRLSRKFVHKS